MKLLVIILWILLGASVAEAVWGAVKRSGLLTTVGIAIAVMCALGLYLATCCVDSVYITGAGMPI